MQHIDVQGETRFYDGPKGLLNLIEEKMGHDTRDALETFLTDSIELFPDLSNPNISVETKAELTAVLNALGEAL